MKSVVLCGVKEESCSTFRGDRDSMFSAAAYDGPLRRRGGGN